MWATHVSEVPNHLSTSLPGRLRAILPCPAIHFLPEAESSLNPHPTAIWQAGRWTGCEGIYGGHRGVCGRGYGGLYGDCHGGGCTGCHGVVGESGVMDEGWICSGVHHAS